MAVPAVLVIGGGIAGMQAALDVGDAGYRVYLVERSPWIGGHMAQLDKTFPTNDCAMCTISPKLSEVGQHPNITLLTNSEVIKVEGGAGEFKVTIRRKPRFVDPTKCNACGECLNVCPVSIPNEFDQGLSLRKAIYKAYPQAIPNAMAISKLERPPCGLTCPAGVNVQGYVALISQGKFKEAYELIWEKNPLPGVCGRVCYHPCEGACNRLKIDDSVGINDLKRFVSDWVRERGGANLPRNTVDPSKPKVAVVGSGPSGLTCARDLALRGYPVTIFEAHTLPGGMLTQAIPSYRLPREIVEYDIARILDLGVELKTGVKVGEEITLDQLRKEGYRAIFLSVGLPLGRKLEVKGSDLEGVYMALDFLKGVNLGKKPPIEGPVAIIGGGNTAIDAARSALRLGVKDVYILYRRSREEMPASPEEIWEAEEEGVKFVFLVNPIEFIGERGKVRRVKLQRIKLGEVDETGRKKPIPIPGSEFELEANTIILAIGQTSDVKWAEKEGLKFTKEGLLEVDPITLRTSLPDVFAGGDVVTGPRFVVDAIAQGHEAAISIDRFLRGENLEVDRKKVKAQWASLPERKFLAIPRHRPKKRDPIERVRDFNEVAFSLSEEEAVEEAKRCLNCGICCECLMCLKACEQKAIDHNMKEELLEIEVGAIIVAVGFDLFDPRKKPEFLYGRSPRVLTGLELERLMSSSGPTGGEIRIGGEVPKRFVFIQCIGSRDRTVNHPYCSRVCCMYTAKQAYEVKERIPEAQVNICYMDVRAYGKGYEGLYERVQKKGILYRRGIPSEIYERDGVLIVRGEDTLLGEPYELETDVVILATGLEPSCGVRELASVLGLRLDENGFFQEMTPLDPVLSTREGIFLAGCCQAPKDISDTVAHASGAAAKALAFICGEKK